MEYLFETKYFGLSDSGFHWLRDRFNYKTVSYQNIDKIEIGKGSAIQNRYFVLVIGIVLVCFASYYVIGLMRFFITPSYERININLVVLPVLPLLVGLYCIYVASKTAIVLKIYYNQSKSDSFPLAEIIKENKSDQLYGFLTERFGSRFQKND
jgi:hypothetical protein